MPILSVHTLPDPIWQPWPGKNTLTDLAVFRYELVDSEQFWLANLLTEDEQARAQKFRQLIDRQRFTAGRGWVRWLVGQFTGTLPEFVQIETGTFGKPELTEATGWQINVAHAGDWVLLALAKQPVGVDIEPVKPDFDYQEMISLCFGPAEIKALATARQHSDEAARRLFYTFWTRKEAIIKATGIGMTDQLTAISVLDGEQVTPDSAIGAAGTWYIQSFAVADTYPAALACQQPTQIQWFTLSLPE